MQNNGAITGLREDEIELELGLSIGGSFGKAEKLKPIKRESKPNNNLVADLKESLVFDPQTKCEIQALRRQEAKKKREEKQLTSLTCQQNDNSAATEERECKKNKVEEFSGTGNPNLSPSAELNNSLMCPLVAVRVLCPYPQAQFVPFAGGFAYSCVNAMPCWGGGGGHENSVVQTVETNGGFRPFQEVQDSGLKAVNGYDSEQNSSRDDRNRKIGSDGSPMYSSSLVSDLQSSSN